MALHGMSSNGVSALGPPALMAMCSSFLPEPSGVTCFKALTAMKLSNSLQSRALYRIFSSKFALSCSNPTAMSSSVGSDLFLALAIWRRFCSSA